MELSKIYNASLYGKCVTVGADAPISIEGREKWLVKNLKMTPAKAHDTVHHLMSMAIYDAARAWWQEEIPDDEDLVTWIDIRYYILLYDFINDDDVLKCMYGGDE